MLPDEKSHSLDTQRGIHQNENGLFSDDFGLRSSFLQEKKMQKSTTSIVVGVKNRHGYAPFAAVQLPRPTTLLPLMGKQGGV